MEPFIAIRETMIEKPAIVPKGYHTLLRGLSRKVQLGLLLSLKILSAGKRRKGSRILNADGSIGHVEVQLSDSVILLFDHQKGWPDTPAFLRVYVESAESVMKKAKDAGSTIVTDVTLLFFGEKVGRIQDPWGNFWWIHERTEVISWPEMEKSMHDPKEIERMRYVQKSLDLALRRQNE